MQASVYRDCMPSPHEVPGIPESKADVPTCHHFTLSSWNDWVTREKHSVYRLCKLESETSLLLLLWPVSATGRVCSECTFPRSRPPSCSSHPKAKCRTSGRLRNLLLIKKTSKEDYYSENKKISFINIFPQVLCHRIKNKKGPQGQEPNAG